MSSRGRPPRLVPGLVMAVVLASTACGGGDAATPGGPFECRPAASEGALVASGLVDPAATVAEPRAVALDPPVYAYTLVVAARVDGEVGAWAMGSHASGARVFALDAHARRTTTWGAAVDPGSPPDRQRQAVAARPEVEAATACVPPAGG